MNLHHKVIMISGAPGSGKTTLAKALAAELNFALLSKDFIKETLFENLADESFDLSKNRKIGAAAMEVLWKLAEFCSQVVIEANFRPKDVYEKEKLKALNCQLIEVYCQCSPEEAKRRFARRAKTAAHHPAHILKTLSTELLAEYEIPVGVGKIIKVNTEHPLNAKEIANKINEMWIEK